MYFSMELETHCLHLYWMWFLSAFGIWLWQIKSQSVFICASSIFDVGVKGTWHTSGPMISDSLWCYFTLNFLPIHHSKSVNIVRQWKKTSGKTESYTSLMLHFLTEDFKVEPLLSRDCISQIPTVQIQLWTEWVRQLGFACRAVSVCYHE